MPEVISPLHRVFPSARRKIHPCKSKAVYLHQTLYRGHMKRSALCIAVLISVFAAAAFAQSAAVKPTPTPDPGTVRVATEEIKINALAFDESGKFAADLRPQDVVITDND